MNSVLNTNRHKSIHKLSLRNSLLEMIWDSNIMNYHPLSMNIAILMLVISAIHATVLNFECVYISLSETSDSFNSSIRFLIRLILIRESIELSSLTPLAILILITACLYMILMVGFISIIFTRLMRHAELPEFVSKNWMNLGYAHLFLFFLPLHDICLEVIETVWKIHGSPAWKIVIALIMVLIEIINLLLAAIQIKLSISIKTKDPLSRTNSIYLVSSTLQKIILSTVNWICFKNGSNTSLLILTQITHFLLNGISLMILLKSIPFYKFRLNRILVVFESWNMAVVTTAIFNLIFLGPKYSTQGYVFFMLCLLISIFLMKLVYSYLSYKHQNLDIKAFSKRVSEVETYWVIHQLRYIKKLFSSGESFDQHLKSWPSEKVLKGGYFKDILRLLNLPHETSLNFADQQELRDLIIQLFYKLVEANPKNSLIKLLLIDYLIKHSQKIYEPCGLIYQIIKTSQTGFVNRLSATILQERIRDIIASNLEARKSEIDLITYFNSNEAYEKLKNLITNQLDSVEKFYSLLGDANPNASNLISISKRIQEQQQKVHKFWDSLPQEFLEKKSAFYLCYGLYNTYINYDPQRGTTYLRNYENLMRKNIANYKFNVIEDRTLYDSNNLTFFVSGDQATLGNIVDCSANVRNTFGYQREELLGKNINVLMPTFFQGIHKQLIMNKLETNERLFSISHIHSFAKDNQGFLVPIRNLVVMYPRFDQGFLFGSIIRSMSSDFDYMLVDENGNIEGFTPRFGKDLGLSPKAKLNVSAISPLFAKVEKLINKANLGEITKSIGGTHKSLNRVGTKVSIFSCINIAQPGSVKSDNPNEDKDIVYILNKAMGKGYEFPFYGLRSAMNISTLSQHVPYFCKIIIKEYAGKKLLVVVLQRLDTSNSIPTFTAADGASKELIDALSGGMQVNNSYDSQEESIFENEFPTAKEGYPESPSRKFHVRGNPHENFKLSTSGTPRSEKLILRKVTFHFNRNEESEEEQVHTPSKFAQEKKAIAKKSDSSLYLSRTYTQLEMNQESSVKSEESKRKGQHLSQLFQFLSFYRFRDAKLLFISIGIFIITILISLWLVYEGAVKSIPQIEGTVHVFHSLLRRTDALSLVQRDNYVSYAYFVTSYPEFAIYMPQFRKDLENIKVANSELNDNIHFLESKTQALFFEKNIRMYNDFTSNINASTSYDYQNTISAVYSIIEQGLYITNHIVPINPSDKQILSSQNYLFYNLYNDFIMKNGDLVPEIYSDISEKVQKISHRCDLLNLISGIIFGCASFIFGVMLLRMYSYNKLFLDNFIRGEYHDDLIKLKHILNQYKHILRGDMSFKFMDSMSKTKCFYAKEERNVKSHGIKIKRLQLRVYFLLYIQRFMIIFGCCLAALIILILANIVYKNKTTEILPVMNDITQVGKFSYQTQMTVSEVPIYILRPDIPVKYSDVKYIFSKEIEDLSKMTSIENTKFSSKFQEKVNENFCPWIDFPRCTFIGKASATQGIIASIHHVKQTITEAIETYDSLSPGFGSIMALVGNQKITEVLAIMYDGIVPAINYLIEARTSTLFEILDSGANMIIKYSIAGALMAILVLISILFYLYPRLVAERNIICQTLLLIPPHMVARNRLIREFLVKEAKIFHGFLKGNMEDKTSFIFNTSTGK